MTKKRFKEIVSTQKIVDTKTNKKYNALIDDKLLEIFNNLSDENKQLKRDLKKKFIPFARADEDGITKVDTDTFIRILQENEQLKQLVNEAEDIIICQCTPYYQRIWENIKKNINGDVE